MYYKALSPFCQLVVRNNPTSSVGKEYFSTICAALAQEDSHVADLSTVGDAQELVVQGPCVLVLQVSVHRW
jgi:hypothetical protein